MSIFGAGHEVVTSTTKPSSPSVGQLIYCTDTDEYLKYVSYGGANRWMQAALKPNRNLIINGTGTVAQRNAGSVPLTTSVAYGSVDRWAAYQAGSAAGTISKITTSLPTAATNNVVFASGFRIGRNPGATNIGLIGAAQALETVNSVGAAGKYITLGFWAKAGANYSALGNNLFAVIESGTGTDQTVNTGVGFTGYAFAANVTFNLTSSWAFYSVTGLVASNATQLEVVLTYGPNGTAGADDNVYITGVQLESGSAPSEFEFESYDTTLLKCQRYYAASLSGSDYFANNYFWGAGPSSLYNLGIGVAFPRAMRIVPTLSVNFINFDNALNGGQTVHASGFTQYYRNSNGSFAYLGWRGTYTASAEL